MKNLLPVIFLTAISLFALNVTIHTGEAAASGSLSTFPQDSDSDKKLIAGTDDALDSFTDGDFTATPVWSGNTSSFTVVTNSDAAAGATGSQTLRLNAPATTGTEYLSTQIAEWGTSQEWRFWIGRRGQGFTNENQQYVWLYANESNLNSSSVQGYRIQIGDNSSDDEIRLEYVNGATVATVLTSTGSLANGLTDIGLLVRVKRYNGGTWQLFTSTLPSADESGAVASDIPTEANTSVFQGTGVHSALTPSASGYLGVAALHSTGVNAIAAAEWDQFYFRPTNDAALPFTNNQDVLAAIGQPNLTGSSSGVGAARMSQPWDVTVDEISGKVYVADTFNNRVLRFADTQTLTSGGSAEAVFGQAGFTGSSSGSTLSGLNEPRGVSVGPDGTLWVSDTLNNRILYFNNAATASNGVSASGTISASFNQPFGLDVDSGGRVWVADMGNNRVVRFDSPKTSPTTFSARACTFGAISATSCSLPYDVHVDAHDNLWIADFERSRVLRYNNASTLTTGTPASGVLGQTTFTVGTAALAQNRLRSVHSMTTDPSGNLYVSDVISQRILIFANAASLPNGANAAGVLGQSNFTTATAPALNRGAAPPAGLAFDTARGDLLASDPTRNRVIRYDGTVPVPPAPPTNVATDTPTDITATSATLRGLASPNAAGTVGYFRYGTTATGACTESYGTRAPSSGGVDLGSGTVQVPFSLNVSGFQPATTYYFCAAAENADGRAFGSAFSFTTGGPPEAVTDAAANIRKTTATLNGFAAPNGDATTAYFRYSNIDGVCSDSFGTRAPSSGGVSIPADASQTFYSQNIEGLTRFTTYYFCSVAENGAGKSFGAVFSFMTRDTVVLTVDNQTDDPTASMNACTPQPDDCSLRGAVSIADDGDTIQFQQQETLSDPLAPAATISLASEIEINSDIIINGPGVSNMWLLAWNGTRVFTIAAGADVSVNNMRLSGAGGGSQVNNFGGALMVQGELKLDRVEIFDSFATQNGGAVYVDDGGVLEITNSAIYGNNAGQSGGAIASNAGNVLIENSTVSGNSDAVGSGAAYFAGSTVTIRNSTITANSSTGGNGAGGITSYGSTLQFASSIISGNNSPSASDIANLVGSIVTSLGFNMIGDDAGDSVNTGNAIVYQATDILDRPHLLGPLQNNGGPTLTHLPSYSYPGLDKGCAFGVFTDQRGYSRTENFPGVTDNVCSDPSGNGTDIGAVELPLVPTAAPVSLSGNVLTIRSVGIRGAIITVYGGDLTEPKTAVTNTFGRYHVEGLTAGQTYIVSVRAGKYSFPVSIRAFALDDNISNADFTADR